MVRLEADQLPELPSSLNFMRPYNFNFSVPEGVGQLLSECLATYEGEMDFCAAMLVH